MLLMNIYLYEGKYFKMFKYKLFDCNVASRVALIFNFVDFFSLSIINFVLNYIFMKILHDSLFDKHQLIDKFCFSFMILGGLIEINIFYVYSIVSDYCGCYHCCNY